MTKEEVIAALERCACGKECVNCILCENVENAMRVTGMSEDYTDLVERLKFYADTADDMVYGICVNAPETMKIAAAAIEKLVKDRNVLQLQNHLERCEHEHTRKERDAAVADLYELFTKDESPCAFCVAEHCDKCIKPDRIDYPYWEWRGMQDECGADLGVRE